jgi:N-acetylglucosaminyl-diphospho-decaprenol L-rhamnosyltransferase
LPAESVTVQTGIPYQFLVINNSADDPHIDTLRDLDHVLVLETGANLGFGAACNVGIDWVYQRDPQAIAWLINPDTCLWEDALSQAVQVLRGHPEISLLGTVIYREDGSIWYAGGDSKPQYGLIRSIETISHLPATGYIQTNWVTGCSLLVNLSRFQSYPTFDADYFLYHEDVDFCWRYAQQGHLVAITSQIRVTHFTSSITDRNLPLKFKHNSYSYLLLVQKHTSGLTLGFTILRAAFYALLMFPMRPQKALGKLWGLGAYSWDAAAHRLAMVSKS